MVHKHGVPTPCIVIQFLKTRYKTGPKRIEMDVTHKPQKICRLLTHDGLVTVLKQVPTSLVTPIVSYGIAGKEFSHITTQSIRAAFQQYMDMI
jgi:hypothetical protein